MQYEFLPTVEMFVILGNTEHALRIVGSGKGLERLCVLVNFLSAIESFLQPHTFIFFIKVIVSLITNFKRLEMKHAIFLSRD